MKNKDKKKLKLSEIGELNFIEKIKKVFSTSASHILCGIGDDTAVLKFGNRNLLFTTDALLEKIHFDWKYTNPYLLGRKSLSVNLSDIAAMGGKPRFAVISLAIPANESLQKIEKFYLGIRDCAKQYKTSMVGGDTDRSKDGWKITIALIGEVKKPVYRSGAKIGDQIWVTGHPGFSALGLNLLRAHLLSPSLQRRGLGGGQFTEVHQNPTPRIKEGKILSEKNLTSAMIDISDGLLLDLQQICSASKVGAKIYSDALPLSEVFKSTSKKLKLDPIQLALTGGEDYELLFTSPQKNEKNLVRTFKKLKTSLHCIGKITPQNQGVKVIDARGNEIKFKQKGFSHF